MAYQSVSYGSKGSDVTALQKKLNENGYQLDVDGVFGAATQKAVKDYQKKQGLQVDGIAGNETWGSLLRGTAAGSSTGKQVLAGVSDETSDRLAQLEQGYTPSAEVDAALAERESIGALRPEEYVSGFDEELARLYEQLTQRPDFRYSPQEDPLYQSTAALYQQAGRAAMEDTLGRTAALSGGYGSSYAQTAAQQAYNSYMEQLAALIPQLEQNALDRYEQQGEAAQQRYAAMQQQQQQEKAAWEQVYEAWQQQWDRADEAYQDARSRDVGLYKTLLSYFADKAAAEQKASGGSRVNNGESGERKKQESLSSAAAGSLERAVRNYLKSGSAEEAAALAQQYAGRMTAAQKKRFAALFTGSGLASPV